METMLVDLSLSVMLGVLVSLAFDRIKGLIKEYFNIVLSPALTFLLVFIITIMTAYIFLVYYQGLRIDRAVIVVCMAVLGGQAWYKVLGGKGE